MDDAQTPLRKRPRPVVSCLRCRDKKLRCDRLMPCENCNKAGCASKCMYGQQPTPTQAPEPGLPVPQEPALSKRKPSQPRDINETSGHDPPRSVGIVEDLQARVFKLEEALSINRLPSTTVIHNESRASPQSVNTIQSTASQRQLGTLVVKGSRSRYHGQNDRVTLLNQVPHLPCISS